MDISDFGYIGHAFGPNGQNSNDLSSFISDATFVPERSDISGVRCMLVVTFDIRFYGRRHFGEIKRD